ncbi:TPA: hypothetical protein R4339_002028 [Pasteurella multocida]|uniref:hypothetical protein n=1 Tax=Pasteurella multocida TaxID=747 RepID=UPI00202250F1|nr:hypothetical protein [Pasteurella multocida]HBL4361243.1 hypothetical protein [Salmonella enterica subsp. enterica serovar Derby]MCL7796444.1 hypothetical protein [Pasteurella multocida]URI03728.1 hypothetical protein M8852_10650 [Pasteurella multocida]HDR1286134.1 hypothetical protein [Pasteurella multocida]HDR1802603.1 hypothetical protein [Pasteurella multocida]
MSKNDIITNAVIKLQYVNDGVIGFQNLIPEGTDSDELIIAFKMILEKIDSDITSIRNELISSLAQ